MSEDTAGDGHATRQAHRGMVSVPGPATSDHFSVGIGSLSDEEGGRGNGYLDAAQDPTGGATEALLGDVPSTGPDAAGENDVGGDRKGHDADDSFPLWKRARAYGRNTVRQANGYLRTMARQQTLRVVKSRESAAMETALTEARHGRNSSAGGSAADFGLPHSTSVGRGLSGMNGGGVNRADVEFVSMEAGSMDNAGTGCVRNGGNAAGAVIGVPVATVFGQGSSASGNHRVSLSSLRRGNRQMVTTGDLVKLLHEEERGGSAADEYGQATHNEQSNTRGALPSAGGDGRASGPLHNGRLARWSIGARTLTRRSSEGMDLMHVSREDRWASGNRSFQVLGVEIGHLPEPQPFMICAGGVFSFLLVYGYMQEYLVVQIFHRKLGLFLTLLQFFGYATCAGLRRCFHSERERRIPLTFYFFLGLLQACMQALTNVSMMYLNYPAKVLFKSSRMVPIMCFGVLWQGRRYAWTDYVVVFLIVTGLVTFMNADTRAEDPDAGPTSLVGVGLISLALVIDAALINIQEEIMNKYDSCQDELIMFSYLSGTVFISLACLYTGDLMEGGRFVYEQGIWCILAVMLFAGAGFLGVSCVAALTKQFGALASAITTTARKAGTLMLSFVLFPKPTSGQHYLGAALLISGLVVKSVRRKRRPGSNGQQQGTASNIGVSERCGGNGAPASSPPTPLTLQMTRQRKRHSANKDSTQFDTSTEAPLLSATGNGGDSSNGGGHGTNGSGGDPDMSSGSSRMGAAVGPGNPGGNPVRHRGIAKNILGSGSGTSPRNVGLSAGGLGSGLGRVESGAGGALGGVYTFRHAQPEGSSAAEPEVLRSPRRGVLPGSPPVTGLGMRF